MTSKHRGWIAAFATLGAAVMLLEAGGPGDAVPRLAVGEAFPDLTLPLVDGAAARSISSYRGR